MCVAISMVLHASGCRDQMLQHAKSNHRYKAGENAFGDLKAGCAWLLLPSPLPKYPFPPSADSGAEGRSRASRSATLGSPCPSVPQKCTCFLARQTCRSYSLVSMSFNKLSKNPSLHTVRLQFLNTCSMGKSNPIFCNTKPCTAPQ